MGCDVHYPMSQTCCGQPLANTGMEKEAVPIYEHFVSVFSPYSYIVVPSASCAYHVQHHYDVIDQTPAVRSVRENTIDVCAFLHDILKVNELNATFPHRVGIHQSCHGLRGSRMAKSSELVSPDFSKWRNLLNLVKGIELMELDRPDECCGFGGTFSINEEAVSVKMGRDRIKDHEKNQVEYITAGDMSCLMHLDGLIKKEKRSIKVKHIIEILANPD